MAENILFGAEFDGDNFNKGADSLVESLKKVKAANEDLIAQNEEMKAANSELQTSIESLKAETESLKTTNKGLAAQNKENEKDFKFIEAQLKANDKAITNLNKSTRSGREEAKALSAQNKQLRADMDATATQMTKNSRAIIDNTGKIEANVKAVVEDTAVLRANAEAIKANQAAAVSNNKTIAETEKAIKKVDDASAKSGGGVGKLYGDLRTLANIIPGIGIGGLIGLISEFGITTIKSFFEAGEATDAFARKQVLLKGVIEQASKSSGQQVAQFAIFKDKLNDLTLSENERITIAKEYNKIADTQNQIDLKQIDNLSLINKQIAEQTKLIEERALALAATSELGTLADKKIAAGIALQSNAKETGFGTNVEGYVKAVEEASKKYQESGKRLREQGNKYTQDAIQQTIEGSKGIDKLKANTNQAQALINDFKTASKNFDEGKEFLEQFITTAGLTTQDKTKTKKEAKGPENVFQEKLAELRAKLAEAQAAEFQSEPLIRNKFEEQLNKEFTDIGKLLKEKKLTGPQSDILKGLLTQINDVQLSKSLDEFHTKQKETLDKINETIQQESTEAANKRVANIRDEFERDRQAIDQNFTATVEALQRKLQDLAKNVDAQVKKGLLDKKVGEGLKLAFTGAFENLIDEAEVARTNAKLDLAFRSFQDTIKEAERGTTELLTQVDENTADRIGKLTLSYETHKIGYEKYQKELTKILREQTNARNIIRLGDLRNELDAVNKQIAATSDPGNKKKLQDQAVNLRGQIAGLQTQIDQNEAKNQDEDTKKRLANFTAYANGLLGLLQNVVSFWSQVNAVEQAALDRSIALQQKRVDNAKDIAEKGNAEYLEMEQKRLDELQRKREENASRQIAINNALTASQAIVAAISAIATAAETGTPLASIAALAAIIGAIGAAFAFANSLTPQSTTFYEGTEYVQGTGRPRGKDTIPARLNIGERVITTDKNLAYWDTLTAIHNGKVGPETLNSFVNQYPNVSVPGVNFGRLGDATSDKLTSNNYEVVNEIKQTNDKLDLVVGGLAAMGFNVNIDEHGLALSLRKSLKYHNLKQKA